MVNIKEKYLNKFAPDLVQPNNELITRYTHYLFKNYQEKF